MVIWTVERRSARFVNIRKARKKIKRNKNVLYDDPIKFPN